MAKEFPNGPKLAARCRSRLRLDRTIKPDDAFADPSDIAERFERKWLVVLGAGLIAGGTNLGSGALTGRAIALGRVFVAAPLAALGTTVEVPTLDGMASVELPSGTQPGEMLTLRGQAQDAGALGVPDPSKPLGRGDTVTFSIAQDREQPQVMRVTDTGELDFSGYGFPKISRISVAGRTCAAVAAGSTVSVARSSRRPARMRSCSSPPMP